MKKAIQLGDKGFHVEVLQRAIEAEPDGVFGPKTESRLKQWQTIMGLDSDGVAGAKTLEALDLHYEISRASCDPWGDGYRSVKMRADIIEHFEAMRDEVHEFGGIVTSSGGMRSLNAKVSSSRSATSMHYLGRAFDLFVHSGMRDPEKDPFIITQGEDGYWEVWARAAKGKEVDLLGAKYNRKIKDVEFHRVTDTAVNFTEIAKKHGFNPIRPRKCWPNTYGCSEWWHFQFTNDMTSNTRFGAELLKIYEYDQIVDTPPYKSRNKRYGVNFF